MKLTREDALNLHRQMWGDMQKELGDTPRAGARVRFKRQWCKEHFPGESVATSCFICEYVLNNLDCSCGACIIDWPCGKCYSQDYYYDAPISEILALPERKETT